MRYLAVVLAGCGFSTSVTTQDAAEPDADFDAAPDAWTVDACPASYVAIGAGRYRPIMTPGSFWPNEKTCTDDSTAGWTHAAVFETLAEAADVRAYLVALAPAARTYGVGVVQSPTATLVDEGWVNFTTRRSIPHCGASTRRCSSPTTVRSARRPRPRIINRTSRSSISTRRAHNRICATETAMAGMPTSANVTGVPWE